MLGMGWGGEAAGFGLLLAIALALEVLWVAFITASFARSVFKGKHRLYSIGASLLIVVIIAVPASYYFGEIAIVFLALTLLAHLIVLARFKAWRIGRP
jgi:hypothetical protein